MLKSIHFWTSVFDFMKTRYFSWCQQGLAWKGLVKSTLFSRSVNRANTVLKTNGLCQFPLINYLRTEAEAVWTTQLVGSRLLSRLEEDPGAGDIVAGVHVCSRCNRAASCNQKVSLVKVVSDSKVRLDNCEDLSRSCESLNFYFPAQAEPFYWLRSQCS